MKREVVKLEHGGRRGERTKMSVRKSRSSGWSFERIPILPIRPQTRPSK